jgi:hypothetical protein
MIDRCATHFLAVEDAPKLKGVRVFYSPGNYHTLCGHREERELEDAKKLRDEQMYQLQFRSYHRTLEKFNRVKHGLV